MIALKLLYVATCADVIVYIVIGSIQYVVCMYNIDVTT